VFKYYITWFYYGNYTTYKDMPSTITVYAGSPEEACEVVAERYQPEFRAKAYFLVSSLKPNRIKLDAIPQSK
jgi:hypothetical protein